MCHGLQLPSAPTRVRFGSTAVYPASCRDRPQWVASRHWLPHHQLAEVCHKRLGKTDLAFALGLLPMKEIGLRDWAAHSQDFADP